MKIFILIGVIFLLGAGIFMVSKAKDNSRVTPTSTSGSSFAVSSAVSVPPPKETDIIRIFFTLIGEKRPGDAVGMMDIASDTEKQAWAVQFNAISSIKVLSIEPSMQDGWTDTIRKYKVTLDVLMDPDSVNAPIPNYGWSNGNNIRWVNLEKKGSSWKVKGIGTGP